MSIQKILPTDTLETGFRAKYNETILEIIKGVSYPPAVVEGGTLRLIKFGDGFIDINLQQYYYTKQQTATLINGILGGVDPLIEPIPQATGNFTFAYTGTHGPNPLFYVQQLVYVDPMDVSLGFDVYNRMDILVKINDTGDTITAMADFSTDNYQLVIRK